MELALGLVCDDARVDPEGKLDVRGAFHDLYAPGFPAKQDRMVLVLALEWDQGDHGRYQFTVDLVDPQGRPSLTVRGHSDVDAREEGRPPPRTRLVMPLEEVVFPVPGRYRFKLQAKGREFDGPTVHLVRTEAAGEPFATEGEAPDAARAGAEEGPGRSGDSEPAG